MIDWFYGFDSMAKHHGGSVQESKPPSPCPGSKGEKEDDVAIPESTLEYSPVMALSLGPSTQRFYQPPSNAILGTKLRTHGALEDIQYPNYSK